MRMRSNRTIRQAMHNEASGVPLVKNAAKLVHFLSPRGFSSGEWNCERSSLVLENPIDYGGNLYTEIENDDSLTYESKGSGTSRTRGVYSALGANDDALILMVAKHTLPTSISGRFGAEQPRASHRPGGSRTTGLEGNIRTTMYPLIIGDHIEDNDGDTVDSSELTMRRIYHIDPGNYTTVEDPNVYLIAGALDRTNDKWYTFGMRCNTWASLQDDETDVSTIGAITPQTNEQVPIEESTASTTGRIFGIGQWKFPGGTLPSDWKSACISMADAWMNGKYTFWPEWGTE